MSTVVVGTETVRAELLEEGTVLDLTLDKPKGNVLDHALMTELARLLEAYEGTQALRLVILSGAGGNFSYGASIEEHTKDKVPEMLAAFHHLVRRLAAYPVPVAALVEGQCLGGGFELVLPCHFVFAAPGARFGCPEIQLGVFPPVLAAIGPRRLGGFVAERMLLTGETLDAETGRRLGLVCEIFASDDPKSELLEWYRTKLRPLSAFALRQGVTALRQPPGFLAHLDRTLAAAESQYLGELPDSHDGNEGIEAFLARRKPVWRDR